MRSQGLYEILESDRIVPMVSNTDMVGGGVNRPAFGSQGRVGIEIFDGIAHLRHDLLLRISAIQIDLLALNLQRAVQTAAAISRQVGVPFRTDTRLREVDLGDWEGCLFPEIQSRYPEMIEARKREPIDFRPPGGESLREVAHRVWEAADEIAIRYPGKRVVLVSHGLALAALLVRSLGEDLGAAFGHVPPNAVPQHVTWKAGTQSLNVHANTLILKQEKKGG